MAKISWNTQVEHKLKITLSHIPLLYREFAEKMVRERAEILAQEKSKSEIGEEEMVLAFFKEVPGHFKNMMKALLKGAEVDYTKYVAEE